MVRKKGMPALGELVLCKVKSINPNSAFAFIEEYEKEGMIHISEIKGGWVRDIRNHLKVGQMFVGKVIRITGDHIFLSKKRVDLKQKNERMKEYKMNQKAEKLLEISAKNINKTLDDMYNEVGYTLQEQFGSLYNAFKKISKNPDIIKGAVPEAWHSILKDICEKIIEKKEYEFKLRLSLKSSDPDGINLIKNALKKMEESGMDVRYISAPHYLVKYKTKDVKKGQKMFAERVEELARGKSLESHVKLV